MVLASGVAKEGIITHTIAAMASGLVATIFSTPAGTNERDRDVVFRLSGVLCIGPSEENEGVCTCRDDVG